MLLRVWLVRMPEKLLLNAPKVNGIVIEMMTNGLVFIENLFLSGAECLLRAGSCCAFLARLFVVCLSPIPPLRLESFSHALFLTRHEVRKSDFLARLVRCGRLGKTTASNPFKCGELQA
jgi:hypothetical protein